MARLIGGLLILALVAGCGAAPLVGPATPTAQPYVQPGGVFTLNLPASWAAGDLSDGTAVLMTFAPPSAEQTLLTVYAVREAGALNEDAFQAAMEAYLAAPYNANLDVLDLTAMGDGSWRATGIRQTQPAATPVNVFMQRDGAIFSALEVPVPEDALTQALITRIVNSYTVDQDAAAALPVSAAGAVPQTPPELMLTAGNLTFSGLLVSYDAQGGMQINGRVANQAPYALQDVTISASLFSAEGVSLSEAQAALPVPVLPPGELAPFSVAFPEGRPAGTAEYRLRASGQQAASQLATFYGAEYFEWDDRAEYDAAGQLHVSGTIWNSGPDIAVDVEAVITLLDSSDRVIGYVVTPMIEALASGASTRFDAAIPPYEDQPARYQVAVQARRQF